MANIVNLTFDVSRQAITRTDQELVASGAIKTLVANFDFCETWEGLYKFCRFEGAGGVLDVRIEDDKCVIPWEVIEAPSFTMACYGTLSTDVILTTAKLPVKVYQSINFIAEEPLPYTPELVEQYENLLDRALAGLVGMDIRLLNAGDYDEPTKKPTVEGEKGVLYLTPIDSANPHSDCYEWIWNGSDFLNIGTTDVVNDVFSRVNAAYTLNIPAYGRGTETGTNYAGGSCVFLTWGDYPLGKKAWFDLGDATRTEMTASKAIACGCDVPDFVFVSHYDHDHIGDIEGLISEGVDFSNATFVLPAKPDFDLIEQYHPTYTWIRQQYANIEEILDDNGISYEYAENGNTYELDDDVYVRTDNCEYPESYYMQDSSSMVYNNFSTICRIFSEDNVTLIPGDIQTRAERANMEILKNCTVMCAPHHARSLMSLYDEFYENEYLDIEFLQDNYNCKCVYSQNYGESWSELNPNNPSHWLYINPYHVFAQLRGIPFFTTGDGEDKVIRVSRHDVSYPKQQKSTSNYAEASHNALEVMRKSTGLGMGLNWISRDVPVINSKVHSGSLDIDSITYPSAYFFNSAVSDDLINCPAFMLNSGYSGYLITKHGNASQNNPYGANQNAMIQEYHEVHRSTNTCTSIMVRAYNKETGVWTPWHAPSDIMYSTRFVYNYVPTSMNDLEEYKLWIPGSTFYNLEGSPLPTYYDASKYPSGNWMVTSQGIATDLYEQHAIYSPSGIHFVRYLVASGTQMGWRNVSGVRMGRPSAPAKGEMVWNTSANALEYWNGTAWVAIGNNA